MSNTKSLSLTKIYINNKCVNKRKYTKYKQLYTTITTIIVVSIVIIIIMMK